MADNSVRSAKSRFLIYLGLLEAYRLAFDSKYEVIERFIHHSTNKKHVKTMRTFYIKTQLIFFLVL